LRRRRASLVTFLSRTRKLLARRCDEPASVTNDKAQAQEEKRFTRKTKIRAKSASNADTASAASYKNRKELFNKKAS